MPIATNPDTGAVVFLDEQGAWQPATTAVNPETKEVLAYDGRDWKPVPVSKGIVGQLKNFFAPTSAPDDLTWMDVAKGAVVNAPSSAVQVAHDIVQPIIHPIDTAEAIKNIGAGVLQKVGILSGSDSEKYADAVGKFFVDRYGSEAGIKKAIATDPVGVLADLSTVLTAGGGALARAPGVVGKVGEIASTAGRTVDPLLAAGKTAAAVGSGVAEVVGGATGTGGKAIRTAAEAGAEGGATGQAFRDNMRGANFEEVVSEAKSALDAMRTERGKLYNSGMVDVAADKTVLKFDKIDDAIKSVENVKNFKGQDIAPKTAVIRAEIKDTVEQWKGLGNFLGGKEFHTAEGLDALKQKIGDLRDAQEFGSPQRKIANEVYGAIRQTIVDQAPKYAKVMEGYEQASKLVEDIERTLSLKKGASIDSSLRKLQSVLRNNVNTNYGNRTVLADFLVSAGAKNLIEKLAGQSMSSWMPRGIGRAIASGEALGLPALAVSNPKAALMLGATLPFTSPRLVGETVHALGRASRYGRTIGQSSFQIGRETTR